MGLEGILCSEIRSAFCGTEETPNISSFVAGIGGRDISVEDIKQIADGLLADDACRMEWVGIDNEVVRKVHQLEED
jgi:pyruvate/2-oxoacid:ferredoxin oxidoreductase alpha subunit